jgi:hypothetical protein
LANISVPDTDWDSSQIRIRQLFPAPKSPLSRTVQYFKIQIRNYSYSTLHCKSVPAQSQIWHTMWQSCLKWGTISHMWSIFCFTCVKYASSFFWHMVCQIWLKWNQQRIIVKHILHNMCQMWLCAGARFTVYR